MERLATHKEKILAIKSKIKRALFYPASILVVAFVITAVIMLFVIPSFKELFSSFGADLPAPTLLVMTISDFFIAYWWAIFGAIIGGIVALAAAYKRSLKMQFTLDRLLLRLPVIGQVVEKATVARWTRTLSTMFAAGVPLVEALESVAGAAGNRTFVEPTMRIRSEVATGTTLTQAMTNSALFPSMVLQMVAIGEESGSLDAMLSKVADFYETEVDEMVNSLSSLMEPVIMVVLGTLIGGLVVAMYLPIFKMASVV
jgi:type IV pilus assembly protein PilC